MISQEKQRLKKLEGENGRKELAIIYEREVKGKKQEKKLEESIDNGSEKPLDYYLGAEKMTMLVLAQLEQMDVPITSPRTLVWSHILAYISHKIISIQEK